MRLHTRSRARLPLLAALLSAGVLLAGCSGGSEPELAPAADESARTPSADRSPSPEAATPDREAQIIERLSGRFETDFSQRSIDLTELLDGGPGKDGIPAIDEPAFIPQEEAAEWLVDDEPVIALEVDGEARAYPLQILMWHEIVNDTVGGVPVLVTFCPLCNTAIAFERTVDGEVRTFGVSGLLRNSDLVMYDRTNESLWQQITGEAVVGADIGARLTFLPAQIVSFAEFRETHPDAPVLSRETGFSRTYGANPYIGYDRIDSSPFFPAENADDRLQPKERVLTVEMGDDTVAVPFSILEERAVVPFTVGGEGVVAFWQPGTVSALDENVIRGSRDVGAAAAYRPVVDGAPVEFEVRDGAIHDLATGSRWNVLGHAVDGPLAGTQLEPVLSGNHFWFSWVAFQPETRVLE